MKLTQLFKAAIEPPKKIYNVGLCHESAVRQDCLRSDSAFQNYYQQLEQQSLFRLITTIDHGHSQKKPMHQGISGSQVLCPPSSVHFMALKYHHITAEKQ